MAPRKHQLYGAAVLRRLLPHLHNCYILLHGSNVAGERFGSLSTG